VAEYIIRSLITRIIVYEYKNCHSIICFKFRVLQIEFTYESKKNIDFKLAFHLVIFIPP
jgi:hypothetical protein